MFKDDVKRYLKHSLKKATATHPHIEPKTSLFEVNAKRYVKNPPKKEPQKERPKLPLNESIVSLFGVEGTPIYENPSAAELGKLKRALLTSREDDVRLFVDAKEKKVYVFDGSSLHRKAENSIPSFKNAKKVVVEGMSCPPPYLFSGYAVLSNNNIIQEVNSNFLSYSKTPIAYIKLLLEQDWSFSNKYFDEPLERIFKKIIESRKELDEAFGEDPVQQEIKKHQKRRRLFHRRRKHKLNGEVSRGGTAERSLNMVVGRVFRKDVHETQSPLEKAIPDVFEKIHKRLNKTYYRKRHEA